MSGLEAQDLSAFGYQSQLKRTMSPITSFALAFSMITITTTIFTIFSYGIATAGVASIWTWPIVTIGVVLIALVYGELATRMPITGFAYQWTSRMVSVKYGWWTGWTAMMAFIGGVVVIADSLTTYLTPVLGLPTTQFNLGLVAGLSIIAAVVINIVGIRVAAVINNVGAFLELFGTMLIGLIVLVIVLLRPLHPLSYLFSRAGMTGGNHVGYSVAFAMSGLMAVWTLMGWEGAADLAEETKDPRRTAPRAMLRSVLISGVGAFAIVMAFSLAIRNMTAMESAPVPVVYVLTHVFGAWISPVVYGIALVAMFSALLANVAVATRLMFSLGRDNMLPMSSKVKEIHPKFQTPVVTTVVIGVVALIVNAIGGAVLTLFAAIVSVAYYLIYILTISGSLYAHARGTLPAVPPGYGVLGRWFKPIAIIALLYVIGGMAMLTIPPANRVNGEAVLGGLFLGVLWYAFRLRKLLKEGKAGPPLQTAHGPVSKDTMISS